MARRVGEMLVSATPAADRRRSDRMHTEPDACTEEVLDIDGGAPRSVVPRASDRIEAFLGDERPDVPFVVIDLEVVRDRYERLVAAIPDATVFYAVKANPAPPVLELLVDLGASFDVASPGEIDACLAAGADPARISYGNTVKKERWIAYAFAKGVRIFAIDTEAELRKVAVAAPRSTVCCRITCDGAGSDWPLSRKFGCTPALAGRLLLDAAHLGLGVGLSFHVGSQQRDVAAWDRALAPVADCYAMLRAHDVEPKVVNIGGGFPAQYIDNIPDISAYGDAITHSLRRRLGPDLPLVITEPGRYLVADAGLLRTEVVLVGQRNERDERRWVYLDVGVFGGLAETMGEAIRYRLRTRHDGGPTGPVVLAGPTCDSADVLYENHAYRLPLDLRAGDLVDVLSAGAYTTTYSTVGFNGFAPLDAYYLAAR
jgi:ornithine decarboxylase